MLLTTSECQKNSNRLNELNSSKWIPLNDVSLKILSIVYFSYLLLKSIGTYRYEIVKVEICKLLESENVNKIFTRFMLYFPMNIKCITATYSF
jgi:hypothetical protein